MNPKALEGERSFPKESSSATTQFVSLINPSTGGRGGSLLSASALCISALHQKILIWWRLKVKRHFCASPYFSMSCWKMEWCCGGGKNWGNDSFCAQTPTVLCKWEELHSCWKICVPLMWTSLTKFKHLNSPLVPSLNTFVSSLHKSTHILFFSPVKRGISGYCKDSREGKRPKERPCTGTAPSY